MKSSNNAEDNTLPEHFSSLNEASRTGSGIFLFLKFEKLLLLLWENIIMILFAFLHFYNVRNSPFDLVSNYQ